MTQLANNLAPKRIVLEDTGERRYPKVNEVYVYLTALHDGASIAEAICTADGYDDERNGNAQDYAIYRIVEEKSDGDQAAQIGGGLNRNRRGGDIEFADQWMELKHEEGGYRHYLNGQPIHAGNLLLLFLNGGWVWARYESQSGGKAALHLAGDRVLNLRPDMKLRWPETWE